LKIFEFSWDKLRAKEIRFYGGFELNFCEFEVEKKRLLINNKTGLVFGLLFFRLVVYSTVRPFMRWC